ncbi:hypothetical protein BH24ACT26_BH24ACT26_18490 [soil metagenome]
MRAWVAAAALFLVAPMVGGVAIYVAGAEDRAVADSYRRTLTVADGSYFAARPLQDSEGKKAGHVFGYQGSPSWVFCIVRVSGGDGVYDIEVTAAGGDTWTAGEMQVRAGRGTWAQPLEVDLHDVRRIDFIDRSTGETLVASW